MMKIRSVLMVLVPMTGIPLSGCAERQGDIPWLSDIAAAQKEAATSNKLMMVDLYTDWCGWCKKLDATTFRDKRVADLAAEVVPVKLNAEREGKELASKHDVQSYPQILFLTSDGHLFARIEGYYNADEFSEKMRAILDRHKS